MPDDTKLKFNERKLRVLAVFHRNGPLTPPEVAVRARMYPVRAMYSYLKHLAYWGLISRGHRWRKGRMLYRLTEKGQRRLQWLRTQIRPESPEQRPSE